MYRKEVDLTDEWLKKNDKDYYNVKKRRQLDNYYLTNRQLDTRQRKEISTTNYKLSHLNYYM